MWLSQQGFYLLVLQKEGTQNSHRGHRQVQSRPFPPRGFCLSLGRSSWSCHCREGQVRSFSCSRSLESRLHGRWPPSRASQRRGSDWRGSLMTWGFSTLLGFSLLGFSFFSFSPFLGFSFRGFSWDPRSPRCALSSPETSEMDLPGSTWVSIASGLPGSSGSPCICVWGGGGPGFG